MVSGGITSFGSAAALSQPSGAEPASQVAAEDMREGQQPAAEGSQRPEQPEGAPGEGGGAGGSASAGDKGAAAPAGSADGDEDGASGGRKKLHVQLNRAASAHSPRGYSNSPRNTKRKRDSCEGDDDSDEEGLWSRAMKTAEKLAQWERMETHKARRRAEQAALNESFFKTGPRKEDSDLGVDINANLLLESGVDRNELAISRAEALHKILEQTQDAGEASGQTDKQQAAWAKRQDDLKAEVKMLNDVSREYHAHGSIKVTEHRDAETADTLDETISKKFYEQYKSGRVTLPKPDLSLKPGLGSSSPRVRSSGGSGGNKGASGGGASGGSAAALLGAKLQDQVGLWCEEEQQLLSAFVAVYGPDVATVARLLCRGTHTAEIRILIDRACDDTRCEVCQSPERGTEMMLCDRCNLGFHTFCLNPPLETIPDDDWFCEDCCLPTTHKSSHRPRSARHRAVADEEEEPGRSMAMEGLEQQASDELLVSFSEVDVNKILDVLASEMRQHKRRLRLRDVQTASYATTFGAFLLASPVPIRNEPVASLLVPLRRHLRIVAHAVTEAFNSLDVINVREIIKAQREKRAARDRAPPITPAGAPNDGFSGGRAWLVQLNPQFARIEACKRRGAELAWFSRQHAGLIREGDKLYVWAGGHVSLSQHDVRPRGGGIIATAVVTAPPHARGEGHAALDSLLNPEWRRLVPGVAGSLISFRILHVVSPMLTCRAMQNSARCTGIPMIDSCGCTIGKLTAQQASSIEWMLNSVDSSYTQEFFLAAPAKAPASKQAHHSHKGHLQNHKQRPAEKDEGRGAFTYPDQSDESDGEGGEWEGNGETTHERDASWLRACSRILGKLRKHNGAGPFMAPVDTEVVPDYLHVLADSRCSPMDLGTIDKNIEASYYRNEREFVKDVRRVFYNAHIYNPEGDYIYQMAESLSLEFENMWAERKKDILRGGAKHRKAQPTPQPSSDVQVHQFVHVDVPPTESAVSARAFAADDMQVDVHSAAAEQGQEGAAQDLGVQEENPVPMHLRPPRADGKKCVVCDSAADGASMLVCDVSGHAFHYSCCQDPPLCIPDGPWISQLGRQGKSGGGAGAGSKYAEDAENAICQLCGQGNMEETMLLCDGCDDGYHYTCLTPPLQEVPNEDWLCTRCAKHALPKATKESGVRALLRREILLEVRRLLHLHAELCSRDYQYILEKELHAFRRVRMTKLLAQRIFDFNQMLLREANDVVDDYSAAVPSVGNR